GRRLVCGASLRHRGRLQTVRREFSRSSASRADPVGGAVAGRPAIRAAVVITMGYNQPLYLLPFDHRQSYVTGMFHLTPPLSADDHHRVADSTRVISDGCREAIGAGVPGARAGILVDEEFGADILRDAIANEHITALSTEKSGSGEFDFRD